MAEALKRLMGQPSSTTSSIYIPLFKKVERMKRIGVPTEETARFLKGWRTGSRLTTGSGQPTRGNNSVRLRAVYLSSYTTIGTTGQGRRIFD
uniref:Uncharacterized protein n=1 Tax=Setaria viridis TaxID=4556 RepID=A0A4U6SQQ1_SETVI|nr:hypothetical protein SEVIR_9G047200v2 [Setaria viridis]